MATGYKGVYVDAVAEPLVGDSRRRRSRSQPGAQAAEAAPYRAWIEGKELGWYETPHEAAYHVARHLAKKPKRLPAPPPPRRQQPPPPRQPQQQQPSPTPQPPPSLSATEARFYGAARSGAYAYRIARLERDVLGSGAAASTAAAVERLRAVSNTLDMMA